MTRTIPSRPWDGKGAIPDFYIDTAGRKQIYRVRDFHDDLDPDWRKRAADEVTAWALATGFCEGDE
ncbi:MAG TPA: hypothetical protein PK445_10245 [Methanolinea sp.]|nr:hypothetical protein [Methanolinea sp.]HQJ88878.1 hypothetical protein [Methanoregulaceae archaeon]